MRLSRWIPALLVAIGVAGAQDSEELTPYSAPEIEQFLSVFKTSYKSKSAPEEDAVAVLADLKKAYQYLESKGAEKTKDEGKLQDRIVAMIAKGLKARKRDLVTLECVRVLGDIGAPKANRDVLKWLEKVLDEKSPNPNWIEYGFRSLAWIGSSDKRAQDLVLKYGTTGRHSDIGVASHALKAAYEWRALDGKMRREFFEKILGYLGGLHSNMTGGEAKNRATYEQRYNSVKDNGLRALGELAGEGKRFANPAEAREFWKTAKKKRKWAPYVGPRFRVKEKAKDKPKETEDKGAEGG